MAGSRASQAHGSGSGNVDNGARTDPRFYCAVVTGRENVGQQRQVFDLRHCLFLVRKLHQVEIGIRNKDVLRLSADPAAHVHIAIGCAGTRRVHRQTDTSRAFAAVAAAAASDVEWHAHQIADVHRLDVIALLDDFACDLVTQNQSPWSRSPAADHVLIGTANVGRHNL